MQFTGEGNMSGYMDAKTRYIKIAAIISIIGNAALAIIKIFSGIVSESAALVSDGVDSSTDVLISIITLSIVRIILKPADEQHPWGHARAETVATAILSFVIFFAGAQLSINAVVNLFSGVQKAAPSAIAVIVALISIAGKILLSWCQYFLGKRADSAMLKANAKNMASDVFISLGVLVGLIVSNLLGSAIADTVISVLIGIWVIRTAISIFLEVNQELMDGNSSIKPYRTIIDAVDATEGASNPHHARMRRIAGFWDIDLDISVDPKCTISEAHDIASRVEVAIKIRLENVYDIMVHVEPRGDDTVEGYGLTEGDMRNDGD